MHERTLGVFEVFGFRVGEGRWKLMGSREELGALVA
jgi:hypothetical protein